MPGLGEQASSIAWDYDLLFWVLTAVCVLASVLIILALVTFAIRFRRRSPDEVPVQIEGALRLELTWTIVPLLFFLFIFFWGTFLSVNMTRAREGSLEMFITGRQWMWKGQQPTGQWENNELHVPVNVPVKLNMTSIDVLHNFAIPAFRLRQDTVPGRYTTLSFTATKEGVYNVFCSEYCGAFHSGMIGKVIAMEPSEYEAWLSGGANTESPAATGQRLFQSLGCSTCHRDDAQGRGPSLAGIYGAQVQLADGGAVTVDDAYIRESILYPQRQIVAGYEGIMPTYQGRVSEEQLLALIAYIRSLGEDQQQQQGQGQGSDSVTVPGPRTPGGSSGGGDADGGGPGYTTP